MKISGSIDMIVRDEDLWEIMVKKYKKPKPKGFYGKESHCMFTQAKTHKGKIKKKMMKMAFEMKFRKLQFLGAIK